MEDEHPPAAPASNPATADATARLYFSGRTDCGELGLALPSTADVSQTPTGPEQVLQLTRAEPLICALEDWLQTPWDPAPTPAAAHTRQQHLSYEAVVHDPALAPPGTTLLIPHQAALAMPPPPLYAPALTWQGCRAELLLSQVPETALAQLQPGALLWLPEACGPDWPVCLHDPAQRLPDRTARLDLGAQRLTFDAETPVPHDGGPQVWLTQPIHLPLDQWLQWPAASGDQPQPLVSQPWQAQLRWRGTVRAQGHLLPLGRGCGLLLHSVAHAAAADHGATANAH